MAGIVACLAASIWIGPVAIVSLVIVLVTYNWMMKLLDGNFNSDGSRKKKR